MYRLLIGALIVLCIVIVAVTTTLAVTGEIYKERNVPYFGVVKPPWWIALAVNTITILTCMVLASTMPKKQIRQCIDKDVLEELIHAERIDAVKDHKLLLEHMEKEKKEPKREPMKAKGAGVTPEKNWDVVQKNVDELKKLRDNRLTAIQQLKSSTDEYDKSLGVFFANHPELDPKEYMPDGS